MNDEDNEKKILSRLIVDEKSTIEQLNELVTKAEKIFRIDGGDGKIIFNDFNRLTEKDKICALLIGKSFAANEKIGIIGSDIMSGTDIIKELRGNPGTIWGKLSQLTSENKIENIPNKGYRIVHHKIDMIIDDILKKLEAPKKTLEGKKVKQKKPKEIKIKTYRDEVTTKICSAINSTNYPAMFKFKKNLDRALYVLKISKDEANIDGLIPSQISSILSEKFRIKITNEAISMVLKQANLMVDRLKTKSSRGKIAYTYKIMHNGEEYLKNRLEEENQE